MLNQKPRIKSARMPEVAETTKERLRADKGRLNPFALKQAVTKSLKVISAIRRHHP